MTQQDQLTSAVPLLPVEVSCSMTALLVSRKRPLSHDYVAATCFAEVCCACCGLCESRDLLRVLRYARALAGTGSAA